MCFFLLRKLLSKEEVDHVLKALVDRPVLNRAWEVSLNLWVVTNIQPFVLDVSITFCP